MTIKIYSESDFEKMSIVGKMASSILDYIEEFIKPGISTLEINDLCHNKTIEMGAIPAPLNYKGFPKSICTSINHVVCHGIPKKEDILKDGDIIGVDVTLIYDGFYGDTCRTFCVGDSFKKNPKLIKAKKLVQTTYEAMMKGINQVKPGNRILDIAMAIESHAKANGFSVVRDYCGHGIGTVFHDAPTVLHYVPEKDRELYNIELKKGMCFTIEPMINTGHWSVVLSRFDDWTVTTRDKSISCQFEHTIGVTDDGYKIFTQSDNWSFSLE
jgi:methionyl aminopeptidase